MDLPEGKPGGERGNRPQRVGGEAALRQVHPGTPCCLRGGCNRTVAGCTGPGGWRGRGLRRREYDALRRRRRTGDSTHRRGNSHEPSSRETCWRRGWEGRKRGRHEFETIVSVQG